MTAKGNKLKLAAVRAGKHGAAVRRIAAVNDLINIFQDNGSGLERVFNYFIIIGKNLLYHIHKIIMNQTERKNKINNKINNKGNNKLYPSRLRGRGVEMPKAFFL